MTVFLLLAGIILMVFLAAHRYSRLYQKVSQAQRTVIHCMQNLGGDLTRSLADSLGPGPVASDGFWVLTWQRPDGQPPEFDAGSGQMLYQEWLGFWRDPQGQIWRAQRNLAGGGQPWQSVDLSLAPSAISDFLASAQKRSLGTRMTQFEIQLQGKEVRCTLECQTQESGNPRTRYQGTSSFLMQ